MEIRCVSKRNQYHLIILFSVSILIKIFILHYFMKIEGNFLAITMNNFFVVLGIYCLASLTQDKKRMKVFLSIHLLLSILFFIDMMYFSHFFALIPIHSIYQVGQLGPVSNSVASLMKPKYFLFFIDTFFLWIYCKKGDKKLLTLDKKQKLSLVMTFFILFFSVVTMIYKIGGDTEGNYTPYNLGVINYHLYDTGNFFMRSPLDIDRVEAVIQTIGHENNPSQGFGVGENKNVIVIQAESLQNFVINREIGGQVITPVLNELIKNDSIYFSQYYEQVGWGNTSDAEFISHNSFYPSRKTFSYKAFEENDFMTLPLMLKEKGYSTIAFHGNQASFWNRDNIYQSQGLDRFISLENFQQDDLIGIGLSDASLFRQSIDYLKKQPQPFYSFFITLTSHHPFTLEESQKRLDIQDAYKDTLLEDYLQTVHYLDHEIGVFIERLKEAGLYDNAMIVIYGDHRGLDMRKEETNELLSSFLEKPYEEDEMARVPLIIHIPEGNIEKEITIAGGQIDFFPTMANLLGLEIKPNKILGKDLLNTTEGFVAKQVHVAQGSFVDNEKIFIMSNDGIFENSRAWNLHTQEAVDIEECREGYERALAEVNLSEYILQNNLVPLVKKNGLEYILEYDL
ncbi:LTA synthase family protein [Clostridium formicaceticum]|uniref:Lipoteichoic acid synthase 2 n=1 Tax=Clostridium formicaceticum TaxID=1497 RepID=A0AAC9RJX2_9CLOT|nr:LTA synthase family protein [Clostridium formicaceticum]AOY76617.1 hypothetical protein BJL90_12535 [Clostridium formicaceticum]ARE87037.1 Lipoteichoic acid synthase 2 [Clostridium formicaceticum]